MKTNWKRSAVSLLIIVIAFIGGCKKNETPQPSTNTSVPNTDNYSSMADFFVKNGAQMQTYTINGANGGSFTTPQGTVVTIPADAFYNSLSQIVTGPVTINFKDIYKKSDMLLSNVTTNTTTGVILQSGGEFFIKATSAGSPLTLANPLTITQPLNGLPADANMKAYVKGPDTAGAPTIDTTGWAAANYRANVIATYESYVYTLTQLPAPSAQGTWCNSDHPSYFAAYPQAILTAHSVDTGFKYMAKTFIFFSGINAGLSCEDYTNMDDPYFPNVPIGIQGTLIAINVKYGKVYSSFTTITLSANQTVNYSLTETTTAAFQAALNALN
jgi:hypothetical protein